MTLVSIGIPTRNRAELLARSARSVLAQEGVELELVITDNASTDLLDHCAVPVPANFARSGDRKPLHEIVVLRELSLKRRAIAGIGQSDGRQFAMVEHTVERPAAIRHVNRSDWLDDPEHWQGVTRQVEDILSDALHERLAQRFVDRRTSVLMRRLRENTMLEAEVTSSGDVLVEGQHVGHLNGFRFTLDPQAGGEEAKTLNAAAQKALASEIEGRANRVHEAVDEAFVLAHDGLIRWLGEPVAKLVDGAHILEPRAQILADEQLSGASLENRYIPLRQRQGRCKPQAFNSWGAA